MRERYWCGCFKHEMLNGFSDWCKNDDFWSSFMFRFQTTNYWPYDVLYVLHDTIFFFFLIFYFNQVCTCLCITGWKTHLWRLKFAPLVSKCTWAVKPRPWRWRQGPGKPLWTLRKVAQDSLYCFLLSETAPDWPEWLWPWCMLSLQYWGKHILVKRTDYWN